MLATLTRELVRPIEEASRVLSEDLLLAILEGLKKRAVAAINPIYFTWALEAEMASELIQHPMMEDWLNNTFVQEVTKFESIASACTRELFCLVLERASAPLEIHALPSPYLAPIGDADLPGEDCAGISSPSIVNGFRSVQHLITNSKRDDVSLETLECADGNMISILRATKCERKRVKGAMCNACRAAQNRWAVRLCRFKKHSNAAPTPVNDSQSQ